MGGLVVAMIRSDGSCIAGIAQVTCTFLLDAREFFIFSFCFPFVYLVAFLLFLLSFPFDSLPLSAPSQLDFQLMCHFFWFSYARRWRTASVLGSAQNAAPNTAAAFVGAQGAARRSTTTSPSSTPSMPGQQQANSGHNDASQHLENRRMHHHLSQGRAVSGSAPGKARRGMNSTPADTHLSVRQGMAAGGPADGASDGWNRVAGSKARMQNQHLVDPQLEAADDGPAGTEAMGLDDLRTCGVGGVKSAAVQSSAAPARLLQDMQDEVESLQQRMQDFCNKHRIDERIQCDLGQLFGTSLCAVLDSARGLHDLHEEQSMVLQRIVAFVSSLPSHGLAEDNFPDFVKGLIARNQGQPATSDHASPAASAKPAPGKGQSDASPSTPIQGDVSISGTVRHHVEATVKKEPPALCSQAEGNEEHMDGAQGTSASQMPPDLTPKTGSRPSQKLPGPSAQTEPQMDASLGASSRAQLMQGVASNLGRGDSASVPRSQPQPRDVASGPGQPAVNGNSPAALDSATRLPAATTMAQNLQRSGLAASAGTVPGPQAPRLGIMSPQPGMAAPKLAEAAAQGVSAAGVQKAGTVVRAPADGMRTKAPMGKETEPERQQMGTSTQATAARTESSVLVEAATRRDQISLPSQSNGSMAQQPQASQSRGGLAPMATQPIGASSQMLPASQQTVGQLQSVMTSQPAGLPEVMVAGRKAPSARAAASGVGGTVPQQTVDDSRQVIRSPNSISSGVPQNHLTGHSHKPIATASVPQRDCGSQAEPKGAMPPLAVRQLQPRLPGQEPVNVPLAAMPATAGTSSLPPHPGASSVPQAPQQAPSDPASTARVPSLPPPNHVVASSVGPMQFVPTLQQQNLGAGNVVQPPSTIARSSPQPTARQPAPVAAVPGKKGAGGAGRPRKAADTEANLQQIGRNLIAQFLKTSLPVSSDQGPTQRAASASVPGTIPASSLAQPIANAAPGHPAKELQPSAGPSSGDGPSAQTSAAAVAAPVSSAKPQPAANQQSTDVPNVHTEDGGASTVLKNVPQSQPLHGTSEVRTVQPGGDDVMQAADALATGMEQAHASSGQKRTRAESFDDGSSLQAGHSGVGAQQPSADRGSLEESPHPGPKRQKGADAPEPAGSNAVKGGGQDSVVSEAAPRAATSTGELGPPSTELGQSSETIASGPEPGNSGSVDGRYAVTVGLVVENQRGTAGGCMLSQNGEAGVGERGPGTNDGQVCIRGNGRNSSHLETLVASNESGD
ncbi:unnamed protein product [Ostreobium quekettii]|uniref:Uncharacterized protein n=1 Tax=Ostreobium quekettii TaxID=121088 RepID=A0A8S1J4W3_9CHLO|nr:unnamed protein product [Ostreobium quekettii]